ncbi:porin [Vibrio sinaloensis]|uniref:porin n=1 Tax=Photobacterium sp. (strain ATCC 43367) TaxID=379097 RepID=UPI0035E9BAD2
MKKNLIALALMSVAVPVSAYDIINNETAYLDIYGEIRARAFIFDNSDNEYTFGDSKLGVDARYAVTDTTRILALVEGEINWDADESLDQDEFFFSKHYIGVQHEALGDLTFGKHSTASDDLGGVDYSEAFGGIAELNPIGQHESGIKYRYASELFTVETIYGDEDGDLDRDLFELYGEYIVLGDIRLRAGFGKSSTNLSNDQRDDTYFMAGAEVARGDVTYGASYYNRDTNNNLISSNDVQSNALAVAARMEVVEKLFGYAGYEYIYQNSDADSLDGSINLAYLGTKYEIVDWASVFAEISFKNDEVASEEDETNLALGATVTF